MKSLISSWGKINRGQALGYKGVISEESYFPTPLSIISQQNFRENLGLIFGTQKGISYQFPSAL
jgi:hypothetical protein